MNEIWDGKELSGAAAAPSRIVKCDLCGQVLNKSYLASHKRLSHKQGGPTSSSVDEARTVDAILAMYQQISKIAKKDVLTRLMSLSHSACEPGC